MPSGFTPTLSMSYRSVFVSAEHDTGDRLAPVGISASANPQGLAKERADKANSHELQGPYPFFLSAACPECPHRHTPVLRSVLMRYAFASSAKQPRSQSITTRAAGSRLR